VAVGIRLREIDGSSLKFNSVSKSIPGSILLQLKDTKILYRLDRGVITPTVVNRERRTFTGCAYDHAGRLVKASQRTIRNVEWVPEDPHRIDAGADAVDIEGQCLYLGHFTDHYGHFLLETLSRFWALSAINSYDKFVFQPFVLPAVSPLCFAPAKATFECFGIEPDRVHMVTGRERFTNLCVPNALVEINNDADDEQALIYQQIGDYCEAVYNQGTGIPTSLCQPLRLYLSRKKWNRGSISNESEVEAIFKSLNFTIMYPEQTGFEQQVAMYRRAQVMAGFAGSALHNSVFMRHGTLVVSIGNQRHPVAINRNQQLCDNFSGVRSAFIKFKGRLIDHAQNLAEFDTSQLQHELKLLLEAAAETQRGLKRALLPRLKPGSGSRLR
jgi:glycosyl transferase family 61